MKKLELFVVVSLFAVGLAALNSCKKETSGKQKTIKNIRASSDATTKEYGESITVAGGGTTVELGKKTTYEFNAVQHRDGTTTGHILLKFRAADGSNYIKVDCLRLFGDNKATMSGVITQFRIGPHAVDSLHAPPYIFIGGRVSFTVQDNGAGGSASPDLVSDIGVLDVNVPASCSDEWPVYLPLDGNVQINK